MSRSGSSLRQRWPLHTSILWRALMRTERSLAGLVVVGAASRRLGSGHITPRGVRAGTRGCSLATRVQSMSYGGPVYLGRQSLPASTCVFTEGCGIRHFGIRPRRQGLRVHVQRTKGLTKMTYMLRRWDELERKVYSSTPRRAPCERPGPSRVRAWGWPRPPSRRLAPLGPRRRGCGLDRILGQPQRAHASWPCGP